MGATLLIINFKKRQAIKLVGSSSARCSTMNDMFELISELNWDIMDIRVINYQLEIAEEEDYNYGQMKEHARMCNDKDDTYNNEKVYTYEQFKIDD